VYERVNLAGLLVSLKNFFEGEKTFVVLQDDKTL